MSRRKRKNHSKFSLFVFQDIITCVMGIMLLLTLMMCLQITTVVANAGSSSAAETIQQMRRQAAALSAEIAELQQSVDDQTSLLNSGAINDPELLRDRTIAMSTEVDSAKTDLKGLWKQHSITATSLVDLQELARVKSDVKTEADQMQAQNQALAEKLKQLQTGERVIYNAHTSTSSTCWLVEMNGENSFLAAELGKQQRPKSFSSSADLRRWILQKHRSGAVFMLIVKPKCAAKLDEISAELRSSNVVFGFDLLPQDKTVIDPMTGAAVQ